MVIQIQPPELAKEEEIVAELSRLGVRYLTRSNITEVEKEFHPTILIAELTRQPSARVRNALISLFLVKPNYSIYVQEALKQVNDKERALLKFFYTAAVLIQRKYQVNIEIALPDFFSKEINVTGIKPDERLISLGNRHQEISRRYINWTGTYENTAKHLLRQWELEEIWSR